jgi:Flp pilus assembly pilin Flp
VASTFSPELHPGENGLNPERARQYSAMNRASDKSARTGFIEGLHSQDIPGTAEAQRIADVRVRASIDRGARTDASLGQRERESAMWNRKTRDLLCDLLRDQSGMETVEWAVLAAIIVAGLVAVITTLGSNVMTKFTHLRDATNS